MMGRVGGVGGSGLFLSHFLIFKGQGTRKESGVQLGDRIVSGKGGCVRCSIDGILWA